jgi:hypothetical protein
MTVRSVGFGSELPVRWSVYITSSGVTARRQNQPFGLRLLGVAHSVPSGTAGESLDERDWDPGSITRHHTGPFYYLRI